MDLIRLVISREDKEYVSDRVNQQDLYHRLLHNGIGSRGIYKLRDNYHLGIL